MSVALMLAASLGISTAQSTFAASGSTPPFAEAAVSDVELGLVRGTHGVGFRITDELSITSLRQTATLPITLRDLWLIDVASPIIAANVRHASG